MTHIADPVQLIQGGLPEAVLADGQHLYALIDHAGAPGLVKKLQRDSTTAWSSLFEGSREQGALEVAPILVHLANGGTGSSERSLLNWLHHACRFSTSLIVLNSSLRHADVALALRKRLNARLPEHVDVMLRYFDTRIFESLIPVLDPAQRAEFLGIASRWQWLDRAGLLQRMDAQEQQGDAWPALFELNTAQQNALIEASSADALVQQMQANASDLCRDKTRAQLHAIAAQCLPKIGRWAIEDLRTQTLVCLTALQHGGQL